MNVDINISAKFNLGGKEINNNNTLLYVKMPYVKNKTTTYTQKKQTNKQKSNSAMKVT